jgi:hypothetical protein
MTDKQLSPEAQAVFWAFNSKFDWIEDGVPGPQFKAIAAALRAASARMMRLGYDSVNSKYLEGIEASSDLLDQIATELENHDHHPGLSRIVR